jgi:alcohol dehydrogenase
VDIYWLYYPYSMQAVLFDAFGADLYIGELPIPTPRPHGVTIKVMATGLCRSDWHGWQGHDSDIKELPHVPGHEFESWRPSHSAIRMWLRRM